VTQPVSDSDGGAKYTYLSDAVFRARYPGRYLLLQLASVELTVSEGWWWDDVAVEVAPIFVHSKLRLVDDRYLSVGSCNMNNRGYLYEGELNVAVLDSDVAADARRRVFAHLVGAERAALLTDDARNNFDVLAMVAEDNAAVLSAWETRASDLDDADEAEAAWASERPSGFVYPLQIGDGYWWDVGPDAF
jgi:phosphatidylserine/phosphatidylglycerophosphate/cardiolipin synthase-like enzyme